LVISFQISRNGSTAVALHLGVIKGAVLIGLAERIGIENVQGTEHSIQV
jgi:hypothetical protein